MSCQSLTRSLRLFVAAAFALAALNAGAADPAKAKADYENRLNSLNALSSALSSAPEAGAEARANLTKVAARKKEAEDLAKLGEYEVAREILDEGYRLLTQTLAKAKSGSGPSQTPGMSGMSAAETGRDRATKESSERSIASAKALLDAAKRSGAGSGDVARIGGNIAKAEQKSAAGDFAGADQTAKEAMADLRPLIVSLKGESGSSSGSVASSASSGAAASPAAVDARVASGKALIDALKRQNADKGGGKEGVIADAEAKLRQAEALRTADPAAALALANDGYKVAQGGIASLQSPSGLKSGSAALASTAPAGNSEEQKAEIDRQLKSSLLLRDAVERKSREKGVDNASTLARIDALSGEARTRRDNDPGRALQAASEANQLAKDAMAKMR